MPGDHLNNNNNNNYRDMKMYKVLAVSTVVCGLASCGTTDTEVPSICDSDNVEGHVSVLADEIEAEAGTSFVVSDIFCDDSELGEVRWDLHSAEGHEHEEGEEEGFVLNSGTEWSVLEIRNLSGTEAEEQLVIDVPLEARGVWDLVVSLVDAEGNAAADVITLVHVDNDHIPEFSLSVVDGVDPASWTEEPVWDPGSEVSVQGTVSDSDGISEAEMLLIREADEAVIWSAALEAQGDTLLPFSVQVLVPADAETGEYHFEMEATDGTGVEMHTGFHLEVE